jgi:uncharacterized protein (DUF1800 family)
MLDPSLPALEKLNPVEAWEPWQPDAKAPWSMKWAGHLYRRAAFGPNLGELRLAIKEGYDATLNRILHGDSQQQKWEQILTKVGDNIAKRDDIAESRAWWLYAILNSLYPLREKMTLFWHNHFATSVAKVQRVDLMYQQNQLLRQHALGNFRPLLLDISHDPAMLLWLDSNYNVKGKPNENYAREVMELFSLGVGHYSEKDIREAARAFTGWHTDGQKFEFNAALHDGDDKTVLGHKGNWDGGDVIRIILEQPSAAQFLARKLYRFFISETASPPASFLAPLADSFRKSDYDIAALVRTILQSRHFFSDYAYRQRIKTPVEFSVGAVRAVFRVGKVQVPNSPLVSHLEAMGQDLFAPPNVKGWVGGRAWLNTATVLARNNFAQMVASGTMYSVNNGPRNRAAFRFVGGPPKQTDEKEEPEPPPNLDAAAIVQEEKVTDPGQIVDLLVDLLLQGGISEPARSKLKAYLVEGQADAKARKVRESVHAIMTMPEYQLA